MTHEYLLRDSTPTVNPGYFWTASSNTTHQNSQKAEKGKKKPQNKTLNLKQC